jgi:DNA polymerase-1
MNTLLIDGDIVAYRAATACEQPIDWGDGHWTLHAFEHEVEQNIDHFMENLIKDSKVKDWVTCLTGPKNFRKNVAASYKANRNDKRKPMLLPHARAYLVNEWKGRIDENIEADDTLGLLATSGDGYMIWSIDKDLMTIPAYHFVDGEVKIVGEAEADYWFFYQTLVGDSTDNYKGCPNIGPKKAKGLLDADCSWETVVKAFENAGLSATVALEQARLARILRHGEYDFNTKEVSLWEPNAIQ